MNHIQTSRRGFLKASSASLVTLVLTGTRSSGKVMGANDRVRVAVVGLNGRGSAAHLPAYLEMDNVEVAYLVDPDEKVLATHMKKMADYSTGHNPCKAVADVRRVLEDKTIDAISIATPNHWHSLMTIWGAQHGKHVYVEKPMSHDIHEGRIALEAQKKYGVVVQHGTQRRSDSGIAGLHEALHEGRLPRLKIAYAYACKRRAGIGNAEVKSPPSNLEWDLWKGPAVIDQYHDNLVHYNWHWFWPTGNGELNNQGTHQLDVARWAIDPDQTHPSRAMAIGGRFKWNDQGETPNTMFGVAEYPNGQYVVVNIRNVDYPRYKHKVENEYYLEDGSVITGEGQYLIRRPGSKKAEPLDLPQGKVSPGGPFGSFISAVRANDPSKVNGTALDAHYSCVVGHMMNNSYRLGEEVPFDAKAGRFGDREDISQHFLELHELMSNDAKIDESEQYTVGPWLEFDSSSERFVGESAEAANELLQAPSNPSFALPAQGNI